MPDESPQLAQLHQSVSDTRQTTEDARPLLLISLCLLALVVGIVTGLGAVVFRALIALRAQPAVPWPLVILLRLQRVHAAVPMGTLGHPGAGDRRRSA